MSFEESQLRRARKQKITLLAFALVFIGAAVIERFLGGTMLARTSSGYVFLGAAILGIAVLELFVRFRRLSLGDRLLSAALVISGFGLVLAAESPAGASGGGFRVAVPLVVAFIVGVIGLRTRQ
jgi:hypothetical protein